jgi:hypothetical protein
MTLQSPPPLLSPHIQIVHQLVALKLRNSLSKRLQEIASCPLTQSFYRIGGARVSQESESAIRTHHRALSFIARIANL